MFLSFLSSLRRPKLFSVSLIFILMSAKTAKSTIWKVLFFSYLSHGLVICVVFDDPYVSQNPREIGEYYYPGRILILHIPFIRMVKFQFLAKFAWITFPTQSRLVLYSYCSSLLHSLITRLLDEDD